MTFFKQFVSLNFEESKPKSPLCFSVMLEIDTKFDPVEKLWEGPRIKPLFNPKVAIGQVIINMLSMHGQKVAQVSYKNSVNSVCWSFEESFFINSRSVMITKWNQHLMKF